jgi:membrane-bound lytic murein transglycosylase A
LKRFFFGVGIGLVALAGCRTVPVQTPPVVVVSPPIVPAPVSTPSVEKLSAFIRLPPSENPDFIDDSSTGSLKRAALRSAVYFRALPTSVSYQLAHDTYSAVEMAESLEFLAAALEAPDWRAVVKREFTVYQSVGKNDAHTVTFSSYYEPTLSARLTRGATYRYPLYGRPKDLIDVDLGLFDPALQGGRLAGRREGQRLVPYYTRQDIDSLSAMKDQGVEIAWAKDPLDVFFLQVEGSGWLDLGEGRMVRIRFDGHNGRKFGSVGQYLIQSGRISKENFSHKAFMRYMTQHADERQKLLNINPRYVFFRLDTSSAAVDAYGNIDVALTPGRSVATDPKLFPKGMLAWVDISSGTSDGQSLRRFVLNQDEGGAIQGPARVDFFAGHGTEAETFAFHLWNPGTLYFLARKKIR